VESDQTWITGTRAKTQPALDEDGSVNSLISADDHIDLTYLPRDLWTARLPRTLAEQAPKVVEMADGPAWVREDRKWGAWGSKRPGNMIIVYDQAGLDEEPEPGVWRATNPAYRLQDMDHEGIHAQVLYNFLDWKFADPALKTACARAFNDWLAEEMCAAAPERLIGLATLPDVPEDAVAELERAKAMGLRGGFFELFSASLPIFDPAWEPLWDAAESLEMPIALHIGAGVHSLGKAPSSTPWKFAALCGVLGMQLDEALASMILSGTLEHHPGLKLVLGEAGIGWIPYALERLDYEVEHFKVLPGQTPLTLTAGEIFRRQVYATFSEDHFGMANLDSIGADNVLWAADYPHGDGTFPHTQAVVTKMFQGYPDDIRHKITWANAAKLYGIAG
jgi:predicted TIM-barrel fold metal-dependent hydrolase